MDLKGSSGGLRLRLGLGLRFWVGINLAPDRLVVHNSELDRRALTDLTTDDSTGERILDLLLQQAAQRPGTVDGIISLLGKPLACGLIEDDRDLPVMQTCIQVLQEDVDDRLDILERQRLEEDVIARP